MGRKPVSEETRTFLRHLGEAIRAARREQHLLQEQLGARLGIHGTRLGEVERGEVDTSIGRVVAIARALGLRPSQLLRRVEIAMQDINATELQRARIADALRRVEPNDLDLLSTVVARLRRE